VKEIYARIQEVERIMGGRLGLYAVPLSPSRGELIQYHDDEPFPAASTIKVFILLALLQQVQAGHCQLLDEISLKEQDKVTGSGVLKALIAGRGYTLHDLATLMIIVSDNTATNLLIDHLDVDTINDVCRAHGWRATRLSGKLQVSTSSASETSPRDLADFFVQLWRGQLLGETLSNLAQRIFSQQQYTDQLGRDLEFDSYSTETGESTLVIASKSGALRGVRNDAGVITGNGLRYVISVMTKDCPDLRFHTNNKGSLAIAYIAKVVHDHFVKEQTA
jgi:beta-lactamase class A